MTGKRFCSTVFRAVQFVILTLALCIVASVMLPSSAWAAESPVSIELSDEAITADYPGVYSEGGVLTITLPGEYLLKGTLTNGQIIVECEQNGKVRLILAGVSVHCETGPALYIKKCSPRLSLELAEGTVNELSDGTAYPKDSAPDGVIYSKSDLTITGTGALTVKGAYRNGIVSKDDLRIKSGVITVEAVRNGICGKDSVEIFDGEITVTAGNDGIKTTNDDPAWGYISMEGGTVTITCGDDPLAFVNGFSAVGATIRTTVDSSLKTSGD